MTFKIGSPPEPPRGRIESGLKKFGHELLSVLEAAVTVTDQLKDAFVSGVARSVGVIELTGLRYPVSKREFKVSEGLTRGSRIDVPNGHHLLRYAGFKSIVDLTREGTDDFRSAAIAGLFTLNVKVFDNATPTVGQMKEFLDFVTKPEHQPSYVHCQAGKGRTGIAVACYRMAVEGWTTEQAIAEARTFGMVLPNQLNFIAGFGGLLKVGDVEGYPTPDAAAAKASMEARKAEAVEW